MKGFRGHHALTDLETRREAGWTKRTTWFDPESSAKLEALKQAIGSYDEAIRQAIMGWEGPVSDSVAANAALLKRLQTGAPSGPDIHIGPVEPKPGSRLKVKK